MEQKKRLTSVAAIVVARMEGEMATSPDEATRKRRIDELEAERQRIEAE